MTYSKEQYVEYNPNKNTELGNKSSEYLLVSFPDHLEC